MTMKVTILSFSFKRGLPEDKTGNGNAPASLGVGLADERSEELSLSESRKSPRGFVFDCRAMPNPYWDESLRSYTGRDKPVCDFFDRYKDKVDCFLGAAETLVRQSIDEYLKNGRDHLQVAFGCTGGKHRSVYFAERMAERLKGIEGVEIEVEHTAKPYWKELHPNRQNTLSICES